MTSADAHLSEVAAKAIALAILGVPINEIDGFGAPPESPDFEIRFEDGAVPFEVTRSTDGAWRSFWQTASAIPRHIDGVSFSWHILTRYGPLRVRRLWSRLGKVLPRLEASGIRQFGDGSEPECSAEAAPLLALGVVRGRIIDGLAGPDGESLVFLGNVGGFSTNPEVLNDLCHTEVANNLRKLGDRGHLFVWVESLSHEAWVGMDLDRPPRDRPDVPSEITVWIARQRWSDQWEADRLWRLLPHRGWEALQAS